MGVRRFAKKMAKRAIKDATLGLLFPLAYRYFARKPVVRGRVLFFETKESAMPDSFDLLWQRCQEDPTKKPRYYSLQQNHVSYRQYLKQSIWGLHEISRAEVVFLSDASDLVSCIRLRPETRVAQLWHACGAFKKWGMSTADLKFGGTRKQLLRHPFYKNLSLVTVSSPEVVWAYEEAMVLQDSPGIVRPLGVSRTDKFFDEAFLNGARGKVQEVVPQIAGKKVLLYAPTFRGRVASAAAPDKLDIPMLKNALGNEWVLLIKHHPFVKHLPAVPSECADFAFDVSGKLPIDELLCVADACVSDYSSLVFEYSLFERPMAFFAYDKADYDDWRGFYYDYDELTPGPVVATNEELLDYLLHLEERFDVGQVRAFRNKFMSACDGHATDRIYQEMLVPPLNQPGKPKAAAVLGEEEPDGIDVSIIIPAYNAMPELERALDSLVGQTYPCHRMEVVVTDDCSADGTWETLQRYKQDYPQLFNIQRLDAASGSPSKPRNAGLERACGKYLFCLDADDWLGEQAVERMLDHAVEWDSDVLLVKMCGENGRKVPISMFTANQPEASIDESKICWSFAPLKLFKRELVKDLRFPDAMPEDIPFVLEAYLKAERISVAADYDYYHASFREGEHASVVSWDDVRSSMQIYRQVLALMDRYGATQEDFTVVWRRIISRDVLNTVRVAKKNGIKLSSEEAEVIGRILGACKATGGTESVAGDAITEVEDYLGRS